MLNCITLISQTMNIANYNDNLKSIIYIQLAFKKGFQICF